MSEVRTPADLLAAVAAAQGGAFLSGQALACGFSAAQVRTRASRDWHLLERGAYTHRSRWSVADADGRHVLLCAGRLLLSRDTAAVSHLSATAVHTLPRLGDLPDVPQLLRILHAPGHRVGGAGQHVAALPPEAVTTVGGIAVTTMARTVIDVARTTSVRAGLVVADAALRTGLPGSTLAGEAALAGGWPGVRSAREVVALADGRAESPLESITRWAVHDLGLPAPETQVEILAPDGTVVALVDFLWRAQRTVGEADGLFKYDAPGAGRREKQRELALERCGLQVVRNSWDDVWTQEARELYGERLAAELQLGAARAPVRGVRFRTPDLDELRRVTASYAQRAA